jgi:hypothetical protein
MIALNPQINANDTFVTLLQLVNWDRASIAMTTINAPLTRALLPMDVSMSQYLVHRMRPATHSTVNANQVNPCVRALPSLMNPTWTFRP